MARSKLRLDTRRPLNDGTYPVQIAVGYGTNIYLSTHIFLSREEWDETARRAVGKSSRRINTVLDTLLTRVANRILDLRESGKWPELTRAQIREMLTDLDLENPTVGIPTLGEMFDTIIQMKKGRRQTTFKSTMRRLQKYCDPYTIPFDSITRKWLDGFMESMADLAHNSRSMYMSTLFFVINYAIGEGITSTTVLKNYRIPAFEETASRALPIEKLRTLARLELTGKDEECRDMFMLSFFLIGMNTVDMAKMTDANIRDGRLEYRRSKTGKFYSIKLEPEALELMKRYRTKDHLFAPICKFQMSNNYNSFANKRLRTFGPVDKKTGRIRPLESDLSMYWARHSWATIAADLDIPKDTISESLGHSYGAAVTGVYIKFKHDKIDAANRKVIDWVMKGIR